MGFETIALERQDAVARVTLQRPERRNAMNRTMCEELLAVAEQLRADASVRAVILTGAGAGFCAGADLLAGGFAADPDQSRGQVTGRAMQEWFNPLALAWSRLPKPTVVAVNGVTAGGGVGLALVGDIVIAAESASFIQVFGPKLGLVPDVGATFHLPRLVGSARAKALALLGEPLTAAKAAEWGMIWECVPDDQLQSRATMLASQLALGPTFAFQRIKELFNSPAMMTLAEQLELETVLQTELADTADHSEGIAAFAAKRAPKFVGH